MRITWAIVVFALAGCNSTTASLRSRFATENGCPEASVEVVSSTATQYRANGCGETKTYVCENATMSRTDVRRCAEEGLRPPRGPAERERPTIPPADPRVPIP